jgi:hypothetical protein
LPNDGGKTNVHENPLCPRSLHSIFRQSSQKLVHKAGEGWSLERTNAVEREYRGFLLLMKMFPDEQTAPLVDVDTFWHYHILDTIPATFCRGGHARRPHHPRSRRP